MLRFGFANYQKEWWHFELVEARENPEYDFVIAPRTSSTVAGIGAPPSAAGASADQTCGVTGPLRLVCPGSLDGISVHSGPSATTPIFTKLPLRERQ